MKREIKPDDISRNTHRQLVEISAEDLMPLPFMDGRKEEDPPIKPLTEEQKNAYENSLDGISVVNIPRPQTIEEEEKLVQSFLEGLKKLLSKENNWAFWQQLMLTLDSCVKCQTCNEACPIYLSSGKQDIYRPTFRAEVLRRIKKKYIDKGGKFLTKLNGDDIELNWPTIARLAELAYRCTICRRCATWCPLGSDNALVTHELRKLFSQEMDISTKELHESGSVQQLKVGGSTGISPKAFMGMIEFMEDEIEEKTGKPVKIPVDKEGADILLIHNSGEFMSWLENPEAFAIIFEAAGLDWTLSSELGGYEGTNYGLFYDDVQLARIVLQQSQVAKKLGVKRIMLGECGHAHKALVVIADRVLSGDLNIPRESFLPVLEDIVMNDKIKLDPSKNDFPVTLHDPCNIVRLMGIIEPQRRIVRKICPQFREMEPHGVDNYCCGGGSGFAIHKSMNFPDWRVNISGRMKLKQTMEAFGDSLSPDIKKYICAPCSNCKGQIRDLFDYYQTTEKHNIIYGGLVELVVNAMVDVKEPYIIWE